MSTLNNKTVLTWLYLSFADKMSLLCIALKTIITFLIQEKLPINNPIRLIFIAESAPLQRFVSTKNKSFLIPKTSDVIALFNQSLTMFHVKPTPLRRLRFTWNIQIYSSNV